MTRRYIKTSIKDVRSNLTRAKCEECGRLLRESDIKEYQAVHTDWTADEIIELGTKALPRLCVECAESRDPLPNTELALAS